MGGVHTRRTTLGSTSYKYDHLGMSTFTTSAGTAYLMRSPSGSLISERLSSGTDYYLYDVASEPRATVVALIERRRQQPMDNIWRADLRDAAAEVLRAERNRED